MLRCCLKDAHFVYQFTLLASCSTSVFSWWQHTGCEPITSRFGDHTRHDLGDSFFYGDVNFFRHRHSGFPCIVDGIGEDQGHYSLPTGTIERSY